jgi:hypothetical protein
MTSAMLSLSPTSTKATATFVLEIDLRLDCDTPAGPPFGDPDTGWARGNATGYTG